MKTFPTVAATGAALLFLTAGTTHAQGSLTPPGPPGPTMYSLQNIGEDVVELSDGVAIVTNVTQRATTLADNAQREVLSRNAVSGRRLVARTFVSVVVVVTVAVGSVVVPASPVAAGDGDATVEFWHGTGEPFGTTGTPQRFVNVIGRASDPDGVAEVRFRVGGGPERIAGLGGLQ